MNIAPTFDDPLLGVRLSALQFDYWPQVVQIYESQKAKETIIGVLNYINPEIVKKYGNSDQTSFSIPHGSIIVNIQIKDGKYLISAPFVNLPEKNPLPLIRQVSEINFSNLVLSQIVLRDNQLYFEYSSPIEMCEPYKLYSIFEEICNNADYYDDIFIEKFGATRVTEMKVQSLNSDQHQKAWDKFHEYVKTCEEYCNYFSNRRLYSFEWDILALTFLKIDFYISAQGYLKTEIEKAISALYSNIPLPDRLRQGKEMLKKLSQMDKDKFNDSLYVPEVFISARWRTDATGVQNALRKYYDASKNETASGDHIGATLSLMYGIYDLYYRYNVPADITPILFEGLRKASGQEWKSSADILAKTLTTIMELKPQS